MSVSWGRSLAIPAKRKYASEGNHLIFKRFYIQYNFDENLNPTNSSGGHST